MSEAMPFHPTVTSGDVVSLVRLWDAEFSEDPRGVCRSVRERHGPVVPVEVAPGTAAVLILDHEVTRLVLPDDNRFLADPRGRHQTVTQGCPVMADVLRSDGDEHTRYRVAVNHALAAVDQYRLRADAEVLARSLIDGFSASGAVDAVSDYALPLTGELIRVMLGIPVEPAQAALAATMSLVDGVEAASAHERLVEVMCEVVAGKRLHQGPDVATALLRHPSALSDPEVASLLAVLYSTGLELTWSLICTTLLGETATEATGGALTIRELIDEALFTDPPMAMVARFPRSMQILHGVTLHPHQLVLVGVAAANDSVAGDRTGNRSHLGWGAGRHMCPARSQALIITEEAVGQFLDIIPEFRLAGPVRWQRNPLRRTPLTLPVEFTPPASLR